MTSTLVGPEPTSRPAPARGRAAAVVSWVLLTCWAAVILAVLVTGERTSTLAQLESGVTTGEVDAIEVAGGLRPRAQGYATVEVRWRDGPVAYTAEVVESQPARAGQRGGRDGVVRSGGGGGAPRIVDQSVGAYLRQLQPDLGVERAGGLRARRGLATEASRSSGP